MRPKIYLFGDSITEQSFSHGGWGSLANHFGRTADVVLRGYSGYNTRWALKGKEKAFPASGGDPVSAVTVFFGANDACIPDRCTTSFIHVPLDEYKQNLLAIVAFLKEQWPSTCIILITPPLIDEAARLLDPNVVNTSGLPDRTNEVTGTYAKQCLAVAAECGVPAVDLWTKMQQVSGWQKAYLRDGLHLTPSGNQVVFEEVVGLLKKGGISPETLSPELPLFDDIDPNDPLKSF